MPADLQRLPACDPDSDLVNVVVDTPKGSRNKYKYDAKAHVWRLTKLLPLGAVFPFDFGFIPNTKGQDGDPIDVLVITEEPTFAGCVLPSVLIGVLEAEQIEHRKKVRNDRLIAAIKTRYNPPLFESLDDLDKERLTQIEHFFVSYNEMEGRTFKVLSRHGPKKAKSLLAAALVKQPASQRPQASRRR